MNLTFDFAFEGFRLIRERPRLIALWGAVTLFGYGLMTLIVVEMAGASWVALAGTLASGTQTDPAAMSGLAQKIVPALLLCAPIYILMSSVLVCAICRAALSEGDDRLGFLTFGKQEVRMMVVRAATLVLLLAILLGGALVGSVMAMLIQTASPEAATASKTLSMIAAAGATLWLGLRLSLNGPQSFDLQRLDIFGSFAMTRDRFWSLFTGYATAMALAQVVAFLCDKVIEAAQVLGLGLKVTGEVRMADMTSMATLMTPSSLIFLVLTFALVMPLTAAIQFGAPVAAYKALRGKVETAKSGEAVS